MTDEKVKLVLFEAQAPGVMQEAETEMIAGVMRIADRTERGLMVPRHEVEVIEITDRPTEIVRRFRETGHSRLPVRDDNPDNIVGVIISRDLIDRGFDKPAPDLRAMIMEAWRHST